VRRFLETPRMAVVASLNPDGSPLQAVAWYLVRDDTMVINSRVGRIWPSNLVRDRRVNIAVHDEYEWVGLAGTVDVVEDGDQALADIAEMARRYHADRPEHAEDLIERTFRPQRRISFILRPTAVYEHLED
jgi:hypothetical protein